jgi:hypothetical protein
MTPEEERGLTRLERALLAHERLKKRIHAFRLPIASRWGRAAMGCVYFTVPLVAGYFIMQATNGVRESNLGQHGELLLARKRDWERQVNPSATVVRAVTPVPRPQPPPGPRREL